MNIRDLKIDMEFASKIPPLTGEELMRLHESILTEGRCISPIVIWDGVIVDGHNRYRFLSRHPEIEYAVYEKDFLDRNDAITEIIKIAQAAPDKRLAIVEKLRQPKQLKPKAVRTKGITFNKKYYENPEELVPSSRPDKEPPISAVLVELGAVVDDFMFRWEFQQETNGQLFQKEECLEGVRKLITQMNDYLGELESKFGKAE